MTNKEAEARDKPEQQNEDECRVCLKVLSESVRTRQTNLFTDCLTCRSKECRREVGRFCSVRLQCGHLCGGVKGEASAQRPLETCITGRKGFRPSQCVTNEYCSCTHPKCRSIDSALSSANCAVCLEPLHSSPAVTLRCKHTLHLDCLSKQMEGVTVDSKRPLDFSFWNCPQCRRLADGHPAVDALRRDQHMQLYQKVLKLADLRAADEGLTDSNGKTLSGEEAVRLLSFYLCARCESPYYGGRKDCGDHVEPELHGEKEKEEKVCPGCQCYGQSTTCKIHGDGGVNFKCRYCCQVAKYFCFGTTHLCERCHSEGGRGGGGSRGGAVVCEGKGKCVANGRHPQNPCEFALGCSICRDEEAHGGKRFEATWGATDAEEEMNRVHRQAQELHERAVKAAASFHQEAHRRAMEMHCQHRSGAFAGLFRL